MAASPSSDPATTGSEREASSGPLTRTAVPETMRIAASALAFSSIMKAPGVYEAL
jgi:hypothetical protein